MEVELSDEVVHLSVVQRLVQQAVDRFALCNDRSDRLHVVVYVHNLFNNDYFVDETGHLVVHQSDVSADARGRDDIRINFRAGFFERVDVSRPA